ncbi:rhodanese-like domain-containing protein [uncultured Amphritea sp.]|uniref:rhodanese-like domain-containing protein n=1 Tax=uncultured Amphritea sp. TaxID=981605 RepID=UPI0025F867FA|nr:rhodanese-like domain-containing protein [uncultured Amphritea sp.]
MIIRKGIPGWLSWLPFGQVPSVTPDYVAQDLEQYLLIDVRTLREFNKSHIPGAISIPLHSLRHDRMNGLPTDKPILCICLSAHRSKPATRKFIKAGFNAMELKGGMLAWWKLDLPLEN